MDDLGLLNSVGVPAFAVNIDGKDAPVVFWNRKLAAASGISPSSAAGRPLRWLVDDADGSVAQMRAGAIVGPLRIRAAEFRDSEVTFTPVATCGLSSVAVGTVGLSAATGDERDRLRERFLAMAAHDLRAPVRNILVLTGLLRETAAAGDAEALHAVEMIECVARRAQHLVGDLLIAASAAELRETSFDLVELRSVAAEEAVAFDPEARHRLDVMPVSLVTNRVALSLTLRILIGNAMRHGREAGVTIRVSAEMEENRRGFIAVTVSDDGDGFGADAREFIEGGAFRYGSGYGLIGLRRIAESFGGGLSLADGSPGSGALVRVTLPGRLVARRPRRRAGFRAAS